MKNENRRSLKLGIMVTVGLILFISAIYYLGSQQKLFSSSVTVKSYFKNVSGLVEGNKVRYSGITVGTVSKIEIVSDSTILVEMSIVEKTRKFIRKDSKVEINSDGLMGSKIVNILPGTALAGSVDDEDFLPSVNPLDIQNILVEAKRVIDDGKVITGSLIEITNKINNGNGDIALLLNDNTITTRLNEIGAEIASASGKVNRIAAKIEDGKGDLGRLINDTTLTEEMGQAMTRFNTVSLRADSISQELYIFSKELNSGDGLISRLVYDQDMADHVDTAIVKTSDGIEDVKAAAETIENSWIFNLFSKHNKNK